MRLLEDAQLVGDCGLRGAEVLGDLVDALLIVHEGIEDLDARGVAEDLEDLGQVVEQLLLGKGLRGVVQSALRRVGVQAALVLVGIHSTSSHMNTY